MSTYRLKKDTDILSFYPVGSIYMSVVSTNPSNYFGGTWEQITDRFILAAGSTYAAGSTGGEATHALSLAEMPRHRHHVNQQYLHRLDSSDNNYANYGEGGSLGGWGIKVATRNNEGITRLGIPAFDTAYTGGSGTQTSNQPGAPHNNMPPYLAVYVWKRTA